MLWRIVFLSSRSVQTLRSVNHAIFKRALNKKNSNKCSVYSSANLAGITQDIWLTKYGCNIIAMCMCLSKISCSLFDWLSLSLLLLLLTNYTSLWWSLRSPSRFRQWYVDNYVWKQCAYINLLNYWWHKQIHTFTYSHRPDTLFCLQTTKSCCTSPP